MNSAPARTRIVSLRGLLVAAVAFAGAVHLLLAVSRVVGWRVEGVGFGATGVAQLFVAFALLVSGRRAWLWGVLVVTVLPFAAWLYTRTVGYPGGPWKGMTLEVHGLEVLVAISEGSAALVAVTALLVGDRLLGPAVVSLETVGPLLIVAAGIPGLVGIEAVDTYLVEPTGQVHQHGSPVIDRQPLPATDDVSADPLTG